MAKKQHNQYFIHHPDFPGLLTLRIIKTKRKTTEASIIPHLSQALIRGPLEMSFDDVVEIVGDNLNFFKHSLQSYLRNVEDVKRRTLEN